MNILITDDEAPARTRLRMLLNELGEHDVIEASSVKDAIQKMSEARVDFVLLDIKMPLLDGFDLVSLLPEPKPAVVFVTAYDEHAVKAFDVEAIDYLTKLDPVRFMRPHRNCIVHLSHVASIRSDLGGWTLILNDGTEWVVARRRMGELKERLGLV